MYILFIYLADLWLSYLCHSAHKAYFFMCSHNFKIYKSFRSTFATDISWSCFTCMKSYLKLVVVYGLSCYQVTYTLDSNLHTFSPVIIPLLCLLEHGLQKILCFSLVNTCTSVYRNSLMGTTVFLHWFPTVQTIMLDIGTHGLWPSLWDGFYFFRLCFSLPFRYGRGLGVLFPTGHMDWDR